MWMKIYLTFLLIGLWALLCHSEAVIEQHLPAELLCSDINCLETITTGILIKDVSVPNKKTLKENTLVNIMGLSADAANSMMKIKFGEEHLYIDPSFVQIKDSISSRRFLKVKNFDTNSNPSTLLNERTLSRTSLPLDEDSIYKSTEKLSAKDHPDNKKTFSDNQRQSNAYDTEKGMDEIDADKMDAVSRRSHDQVSKQEATYEIDSDEVDQDDKIEEDNEEDESYYNNSSEAKFRDTALTYGETDTTDSSFESHSESLREDKARESTSSIANEMQVSETEHVKTPVSTPSATVSPSADKDSKKDASSRSEQNESIAVNQQPSSIQSYHVEMQASETEHVETSVSTPSATVSPSADKDSKKDASSRSEQNESIAVNQQPSSIQSYHVEMQASETEHVETSVSTPSATVSPSADKDSKKDASSRSEQNESIAVNQQPSSIQSHHVEMQASETEHVETSVSTPSATVSPSADKGSKKDASSRSEQNESIAVNQQPSSIQSHHVEMQASETEHVETSVSTPSATVSPSADKGSKKDASSRSEQNESIAVNQQPSSIQSHHVEMQASETEHVETSVSTPSATVSPSADKDSKKDASSRSEQNESIAVNQQPSSIQSYHVEMQASETEHVETSVSTPSATVSSSTDEESRKNVSQASFAIPSNDLLDNDSYLETNKLNSSFPVHDHKQAVISSNIDVQNIGIIYSSNVNSSTSPAVPRQMFGNQNDFDPHGVPVHLGLIHCIYWAANASFDKTYSETVRSPFSRFLVNGFTYFFAAANFFLQYLPENIISNLDNFLLETFSLSINFIIAWMIFIFHLIFLWNLSKGVHFLLSKYIFSEKYTSPSLVEYLKLEEYSIQLASQLSDMEESNSHLSKWANSLSCSLQNLQEEYTSKLSEMTLSVDDSRESFIRVQSELNHLKSSHNSLEQNLRLQLTDKEEVIHELNTEINRLKQLHSENDDKWKKSLLDLEENNRKSIEELKEEQEQLYSQANLYYNRMKTMQSEVDKILESRKASEEKLLTKEAEFQSLLATFNTLKGLELILEQESSSKQKTNDMEEREVTTTDNLSYVSRTLEDDVEISDKSSTVSESDLNEVDEKITEKSRLQKNLSLLLDVGRLHAQIRLKDEQIKTEECRAKNEHDLRVQVESKMEEIERENSTLKANLIQIEEEKNAYQTKLDILSCYFKERELELQRDLGKHVVVGSESSEALKHSRKRNQELEGEVKVLRDQMAALRRELVETERTSRRQISELDKRSHENWLAARASDHQIQDLREENSSLRQKLIESENNALRSSIHTFPEKINSSSREKIMNIFPRPILPQDVMKNSSLRDVRSQSRNSLVNLTSQRPVAEANPFTFIPKPSPRGIMPFPGGIQRDALSTPRPLLPGFPPVQMGFPPGFLPPPFPPVIKTMIDQNNKQNSSPSSVSGSLK
uniref:Transport and Golgi organization protein 1 n=1 Tax=Schistosoma mansoni TaxID=6183 RepID=A0A3Q0KDP6_SCHMA